MNPLKAGTEYRSRIAGFTKLAVITLIATYFLILVGSSVRASGAGMGCPDWPTCFGRLIPPVSVTQLPADYQLTYADRGYGETAFNPRKTWTEFGNRLTSVLVGLLMIGSLVYALLYLRYNRKLLTVMFGMIALTALQAWLGSVVVASYLHPLIVSSHMVLALGVIACLHTVIQLARPPLRLATKTHVPWLFMCGMLLLLQVGLGLQVREQVDLLTLAHNSVRATWVSQLGETFSLHMVLSLLVSGLAAFTIYRLWNDRNLREANGSIGWCLGWWSAALLGNMLFGTSMWLFAIPPVLQPLHLLSASLQIGMVWHLLLLLLRSQSPGARKHSQAY